MDVAVHPGEVLALARRRKALMESFRHSDESGVLREHLEERRENAFRRLLETQDVNLMLHWRGVWQGLNEALSAPERIIREATNARNE